MSKIIKITAFFLFFAGLFSSYSLAALADRVFFSTLAECRANCTGTCTETSGISLDGSPALSTFRCNASGCGTAGTKQYKYTASGCTHTTETNTCCSNGSWSGFGKSCPTTKECTGTKPATRQACFSGYQTRSVSCNTSTGNWTTGAWGTCDCTNSDYEWVTSSSGSRCCQHKNCSTGGSGTTKYFCCDGGKQEYQYSWQASGGEIYCNGLGVSSLTQCGTCNGTNQECRVIVRDDFHLGMEEADSKCIVYHCR